MIIRQPYGFYTNAHTNTNHPHSINTLKYENITIIIIKSINEYIHKHTHTHTSHTKTFIRQYRQILLLLLYYAYSSTTLILITTLIFLLLFIIIIIIFILEIIIFYCQNNIYLFLLKNFFRK